ncbi:MAG: ATP-binding protein [Deltaproteobacteria bacterium]|nr:ATP-binding protein [Deltaproteobacteria bacterium]
MTGKTVLLEKLKHEKYYDLLDPELEIALRAQPKQFLEELATLSAGSCVIVDEIQKVPILLDYVQIGIEKLKLKFFLSGSSARKLKRGGANLLGGRAADLRLHPLTTKELGQAFNIESALTYGTLPKIQLLVQERKIKDAIRLLRSYHTTYLKEEIQAEAIVRSLDAFQRFLPVAAQANAQMIEYANISRECSVPMETVKDYFQILEDTLVGNFLWPWNRSERRKARPKFYFFDCGVVRALQNLAGVPLVGTERGFFFETWFVNEIIRIKDYEERQHKISLWREGEWEIDILVEDGRGPLIAFECKTSKQVKNGPSLNRFRKQFPQVPLIVSSLTDANKRKLENGAFIYPWHEAIKAYRNL